MKATADLFERIRIKPDPETGRTEGPRCEAPGCARPGAHRAPKGRLREGEYFHFCLEHVRVYNRSYNYFNGMSDADVQSYMKSALTGHRPTWAMGGKAGSEDGRFSVHFDDPFDVLGGAREQVRPPVEERPSLRRLEARAFDTLGLDPGAGGAEIKSRYKELVKRHHPDANGGDRSSEEKLRAIISAYKHLKAAGFCGRS